MFTKFMFLGVHLKKFFKKHCYRPNKNAIVIVGNQKTGSTAVACLLSKATGKCLSYDFIHEYNPPGQDLLFIHHTPLKKIIMQHKHDFSKEIIKELGLVFCLEQVFSFFSKGKFILIVRDPRDNIRSILNRLDLLGNKKNLTQKEIETLPKPWQQTIEGTIYNTFGNNHIEVLAHRWNAIANQYFKYSDKITLVRYEDFSVNKAEYINKLAKDLGLVPSHDISSDIDTQFQPKGNNSQSWENFFGSENLDCINSICAKQMKTLGYHLHPESN